MNGMPINATTGLSYAVVQQQRLAATERKSMRTQPVGKSIPFSRRNRVTAYVSVIPETKSVAASIRSYVDLPRVNWGGIIEKIFLSALVALLSSSTSAGIYRSR